MRRAERVASDSARSVTGRRSRQMPVPVQSTYAERRGNAWYVATTGNNLNAGTIGAPFATLKHAHDQAAPGDWIRMRGGLYPVSGQIILNNPGTALLPILVSNFTGETPILDATTMAAEEYVLSLNGLVWNRFAGLVITAGGMGGLRLNNASDNQFERMRSHHNGRLSEYEGKGIAVVGSSARNAFIDCDSDHNVDSLGLGDNGDGWQFSTTGAGNSCLRCTASDNSDDGFDCFNVSQDEDVTIAGVMFVECSATSNGYPAGDGRGFKLGGQRPDLENGSGGNTLLNCNSDGNRSWGYDANGATVFNTLTGCAGSVAP